MRRVARVLVASVLVACKKDAPVVITFAPDSSAPVASVAPASSSAKPVAPEPTLGARIVLKNWNDAHNAHDSRALEALYADDVRFYGARASRAECAKRKAAAFVKSPDYAQSVHATSFVSQDGGYLVRFTKTSTSGGKSTDYPSFIVVVGGRITEESDKITDENVRRARMSGERWCVDADNFPNDAIKPPFTVSALGAMGQVMRSHHADDLRTRIPDLGNDTNMTCPTPCTPSDPTTCGLGFRLFDMSQVGIAVSTTVEHVYVDAVADVMWWDESGNGTAWKSEKLSAPRR